MADNSKPSEAVPLLPYLILFSQSLLSYRLPELDSIALVTNVPLVRPPDELCNLQSACMVVHLRGDEDARKLGSRGVLVKSIYELYGLGKTYDELHIDVQASRSRWAKYVPDASYALDILAPNHSVPRERWAETLKGFGYLSLSGRVDLKNPDVRLVTVEDYPPKAANVGVKAFNDLRFRNVFFGRKVCDGQRDLIKKFDVKKRRYFGNTSMEAEISILMANQALAGPGKLHYDPFAGTGSMLYLSAHFGSYVFGSDLDGRQMRGQAGADRIKHPKAGDGGISAAAESYRLQNRFIDLLTADVTRVGWRRGGILDGIITDPPYGVRAGAKRLGLAPGAVVPPNLKPTSFPPIQDYALPSLASDLLLTAFHLLRPGGRLVYFLPTVNDEYQPTDVPEHPGMRLVANSIQDFGKWARRLITMEKKRDMEGVEEADEEELIAAMRRLKADWEEAEMGKPEAARSVSHQDFRVKYFNRFTPVAR